MPDINMQKKIELLSQKVSEYFNIEQIPISFDDTILDDSRLNIKPKFSIVINRKFKNDYFECAKAITHEYRHLFQIVYSYYYDDEIATNWKRALQTMKSSENADIINDDDEHASYAYQELEIDAFAFTKYYLDNYEDMTVVHPNKLYEKIITKYIENNRHLFN